MFSKVFSGTVEAGLHGRHARAQSDCDLRMTAPFLHEGEQSSVLRPKLGERMAQSVEFFGPDRALGFRDVLVFRRKRREDASKFLAAEVIDAGVSREPEKPGLKLGRRLEPRQREDHLDKDKLSNVLDGITAADDRIDKPGNPVLVSHDKLALGVGLAALGASNEIDRRSR
jgi:hypothetical protein